MQPVVMEAETVRIGRGWRVLMTAYGTAFVLAAVIGAGFLISADLWPFGLVFAALVGALGFVCFRSARCRIEIHPDELVVANQFTTTVMRRTEVAAVELGRSSNPLGVARTVVLQSTSGHLVRIDAAARRGQADAQLAPLVDQLIAWSKVR